MQQASTPDPDDAASVMPAITAVAFFGGPLTTMVLWKHGPLVALLSAPLGASAAGLAAALSFATLRYACALRSAHAARRIPAPEPVAMIH